MNLIFLYVFMNNLIFNSFDYNNELYGKKIFSIKKNEKDKYIVAETMDIIIENIMIYNKSDFIQLDLIYDKSNDEEFINELYNILIDDELENKYNNFITKNSIQIYLNKNDKTLYIDLLSIDNLKINASKKYYIISIFTKNKNIEINIDDIKSRNFDLMNDFFNRNDLNQNESNFIINNYQQQEYNKIHKTKQKKEIHDKDFDNFKDFMNKDDSDLSEFKITKEEKKIFNPESLKIIDGSNDPNKDINNLIGLNNIKTEIQKLNAKISYHVIRESRNIFDLDNATMHMCFYGNPGTGKTTVARIMTGVLYNMGYIKKNKCIEINANELKGSEIGQTAIKTKIILRNAKNKVLFIDEAYALNDKKDGFGKEAVDTIIKEMEDNKSNMIIIFAGYEKEMKDFLSMNEGLKSRINRYISFENYNSIELGQIFINLLKSHDLTISTEALIKTMLIFKKMSFQQNFSNGRFVRNYFEDIEEEHALNTINTDDVNILNTISLNDINDDIINNIIEQNKQSEIDYE